MGWIEDENHLIKCLGLLLVNALLFRVLVVRAFAGLIC